MEIKNAIIESATINDADRGLLTVWLTLKYGDGTGQGFGGYTLYLPKTYKHHKMLSHAGHFIWRCMEIAEVSSWDKMKGKTIRVKAEHSKVHSIGHIVKDDWFDPAKDFQEGKNEHS